MNELLNSKKFWVGVAATILGVAGLMAGYPPEDIVLVTGPLMAYVIGQGLADLGKEKAKIERG